MQSFVIWWLRVLRRRWLPGGLLFAVVAGLGAAVLFLSAPVHRAEAKLRLGEAPPMAGASPAGGFIGLFRVGGDPFANDLELLSSRTLAEGVVDDAALNVRLVAPRGWHRDSLTKSIVATRTTRRAAYEVEWLADGGVEVRLDSAAAAGVRGEPGEPIEFGGTRIVFRSWRAGMPRRIGVRTIPHAEAARLTGGRIVFERTRRDANVVAVQYNDPDPGLAHMVLTSAVNRFTALRTSIQQRESRETIDSLRTIAEQTRAELGDSERALESMQRTTGMIAPEAQAAAAIEQYTEASAQLQLTRIEMAALDAALEQTRGAASPADAWSALLAYPRFLENEMLAGLIAQMTGLEAQRRELARRRTESNVELRAVLDQIEYLDRSLRDLARDHRAALTLQLTSVEGVVREIDSRLARMPAHTIEMARLQRDVRVLAEMVVLTEQRLRQEQLRLALTFANVQVIDPPALRDRPVWPRRKLGLAVALLLAGTTALVGMATIERADTTVRRAADMRAALGAPVLGVVRRFGRMPATLSSAETDAVVRRGAIGEPGRSRIAIAAVDDATLARVAVEAIKAGSAYPPGPDLMRLACPDLITLETIDSFAAAAAAAAVRAPILLVARAGSTRAAALSRAAGLLAEADATVAGMILVCDRARDAADVWV